MRLEAASLVCVMKFTKMPFYRYNITNLLQHSPNLMQDQLIFITNKLLVQCSVQESVV